MTHAPLILASASPRRLDLLKQIGIVPAQIIPADIDETPLKNELPRALALRLSQEKCATLPSVIGHFVLAADTVVAVGRRILPKGETVEDATHCLDLLSGRSHRVITGFTLRLPDGKTKSRLVSTRVTFKHLTSSEKSDYIASREWHGKAGAYGIQGLAAGFVSGINGSYSNIVGLPLYEFRAMLSGVGVFNRAES
jgi:septum formation protein